MKAILKTSVLMSAVVASLSIYATNSQAAATITFGEDKYVSVGFGFITSYSSVEDAAANGDDRSNDFSLNSARLYLSGSFNKYIKGMLNTERSGGGEGNIEVIDANVQFQLTPEIAIWAGRFLSPSDRANMAGPYYSSGGGGGYWANISSRYGWNGGVIGRDEGVAFVGSFLEDKLAVSFGAFEGDNIFRFSGAGGARLDQRENSTAAQTLGADDKLMYAGRVQVAFWDAEPGYYGTGNYFGAKDILTVGIAGRQKTDGAISTTAIGDYSSYSVDFLMEKKNVGPGTLSLEAAYYDYDTDKVFLAEEGDAYYVGAGYLFDTPVGWGKFMPFVRHQEFDADNNIKTKRTDFGVNYVIAPYNALISAEYQKTDVTNASDTDAILISLQMQF
ncbi:MAG: porin [Methylophilus sp.]|nr:porin [Methylophilus sp.]MDP3610126.1 porin [Methylophilus sp.]